MCVNLWLRSEHLGKLSGAADVSPGSEFLVGLCHPSPTVRLCNSVVAILLAGPSTNPAGGIFFTPFYKGENRGSGK